MKQIMITGDLHIGQAVSYGIVQDGLSTKLLEQKMLLKNFVDDAIARSVDLVVFGGDYFPKHIKINPDAMRVFSEQVLRLSQANIAVKMVVGNHDKPRHEKMDTTINYFDIFRIPNVEIISLPKVELWNDTILYFFPHLIWTELYKYQRNEREGITEIVNRIIEELISQANEIIQSHNLPEHTKKIFFGHFGLTEAGKGGESTMLTGNDICVPSAIVDRPGIDLCVMSHIHKFWINRKTEHSKVIIIGSMDRFDFGEAEDKKVYGRIEINDENELHFSITPTRSRKFVNIKGRVDDQLDISFLDKYDINGAIVKVVLIAAKEFSQKKEIVSKIQEYLTAHGVYHIHHVGFVPQTISVTRSVNVTEEKDVDENVLEILKTMSGTNDIFDDLLANHKTLFEEIKKESEGQL